MQRGANPPLKSQPPYKIGTEIRYPLRKTTPEKGPNLVLFSPILLLIGPILLLVGGAQAL